MLWDHLLQTLLPKFSNSRIRKQLEKTVEKINLLEPNVTSLSDTDLRERTPWLRRRLESAETLEAILPDAFATVREVARRVLGERHFDVQLMGGVILHQGKIAEMKTGEGKTLVATLPVYLNALGGKGVHVVTVNDYLSRRDSEWMGAIYRFLGLEVGCIVAGLNDQERQQAYQADVTYGTNNEFGFDYLRDNMKLSLEEKVQRPFHFAIVDEVDSILIDEARTPLIISGPSADSSALYIAIDEAIPALTPEDYEKDEKHRSVTLTEPGIEKIEEFLRKKQLLSGGTLYDSQNTILLHHVTQGLRAHQLFTRNKDYIVKNNKVVIIDEFTGRMMEGRRYSEGLHQALEAKEQVSIQAENQTLASITFQNYFRLYPKLSGMTGTALTEAAEFSEIYGLDVVEIPTNEVVRRVDYEDEVYRKHEEKIEAILTLIETCYRTGQPVLVGTVSIEKSEELSKSLKKKKIPHNVLNARYHEQEAQIIAQAGQYKAVTIATNMAGRGTDIQLGGSLRANEEDSAETLLEQKQQIEENKALVKETGGLFVIGTERHESRRIDNQLRGRSGRQGDPGATKFFLSLEDDLMRIFGSDKISSILERIGLEEGEAITHTWITKALERAQKKIEAHNFEIRKNLLKFDNVLNDQRKAIYEQRAELMEIADVSEMIGDMRHTVINDLVDEHIPSRTYPEQWDLSTLEQQVGRLLNKEIPLKEWSQEEGIDQETVKERLQNEGNRKAVEQYARFTERQGAQKELIAPIYKNLTLKMLDHHWRDHLLSLDYLRQGINLRAYGQRDPLNEYKREAFALFENLLVKFRYSVTYTLMHLDLAPVASTAPEEKPPPPPSSMPPIREKVGRNMLCPCGSGKKYKHCHGKIL